MTEQQFISRHRDRWKAFEDQLKKGLHGDPDRLSRLYIELIDDLSYARTHFRQSSLILYLNQLAVAAHQQIYGTRREQRSRLWTFFRDEVPLTFRASRRFFGYAFAIFSVAILFGWMSGLLDPEFLRVIVGDNYVNQTLENIKSGDPMGIYASSDQGSMFMMISVNNIRVAFLMFVVGVFGGLPTALLLVYNGVMFGAFIQFFFQHDLGWTAINTVMLHGAMELTAIVIAGGCGLMLGSAVLFPGTYARAYYVILRARQALKIIVGVSPFIISAAIIESYLTRHYLALHEVVQSLIICSTLIMMLFYLFSPPKSPQHELRVSKET
jgi:uncharacterized membrane protein SpoIIM required for sporulation